MGEPEETPRKLNPLELMFTHLTEGRNELIRERKASAYKRYAIARDFFAETYKDMPPEYVPVDMQRVLRDFRTHCDSEVDEHKDAIEKDYRIVEAVLRTVAEKYPEVYEGADKKMGRSVRTWKANLLPVAASGVLRYLPVSLIQMLSTDRMRRAVGALREAMAEGLNYTSVAKMTGLAPEKATSVPALGAKRRALARFLAFLKNHGHIDMQGQRRGVRYIARPSLEAFARMLEK